MNNLYDRKQLALKDKRQILDPNQLQPDMNIAYVVQVLPESLGAKVAKAALGFSGVWESTTALKVPGLPGSLSFRTV